MSKFNQTVDEKITARRKELAIEIKNGTFKRKPVPDPKKEARDMGNLLKRFQTLLSEA